MKKRFLPILASTILLFPGQALANTGVPMLFVTFPSMVIALLPIILLEMMVLRQQLNLPMGRSALVSAAANAFSTLVGVPLAWLGFMALEIGLGYPVASLNLKLHPVLEAIIFAAWIAPEGPGRAWMVPFSTMVLLAGCFFVSVWLEKRVALRFLKDWPVDRIHQGVWRANLFSYALLELIALGFLIFFLWTK